MYVVYLMLLSHVGILLLLIQNLILSYKKDWYNFFGSLILIFMLSNTFYLLVTLL